MKIMEIINTHTFKKSNKRHKNPRIRQILIFLKKKRVFFIAAFIEVFKKCWFLNIGNREKMKNKEKNLRRSGAGNKSNFWAPPTSRSSPAAKKMSKKYMDRNVKETKLLAFTSLLFLKIIVFVQFNQFCISFFRIPKCIQPPLLRYIFFMLEFFDWIISKSEIGNMKKDCIYQSWIKQSAGNAGNTQ